jgi:hypothetical protein
VTQIIEEERHTRKRGVERSRQGVHESKVGETTILYYVRRETTCVPSRQAT